MKNKKSKAENTGSSLPGTLLALGLSFWVLAWQGPAHAIEALDDAGMAAVNGQGIAILPENFKIVFNDLAYTQAISTGTPSGNVGDMYWYGMALGGENGNVSGNAFQNARKVGNIVSWGSASNPWLLKVESPAGYLYDGTYANYPVMNYYAPKPTTIIASGIQDGGLKYSFWGDIVIRDKNNPVNCTTSAAGAGSCMAIAKLQSQSVWNGFSLNGSRFSIFQNTYDKSFGFSWINRINSTSQGLLRFTVAETATPAGASTMGRSTEVPVFSTTEGMYMKDLDINMIVGVQHYQPVILDNAANVDDPATFWNETKNFSVEVTRIPNVPNVYNAFYEDYSAIPLGQVGAKTCQNTTPDCSGATHGQIRINDIYFNDVSGNKVDLGGVNINGLMIQHMKLTTTGI